MCGGVVDSGVSCMVDVHGMKERSSGIGLISRVCRLMYSWKASCDRAESVTTAMIIMIESGIV